MLCCKPRHLWSLGGGRLQSPTCLDVGADRTLLLPAEGGELEPLQSSDSKVVSNIPTISLLL